MRLAFWWRSVDLRAYLRRTKTIRINGIRFEIRKIDIRDHMAGLNVVIPIYQLYAREKTPEFSKGVEDLEKVRKFLRDFLYAGVVSPKLTMKNPPEEGAIHVDELTADLDLSRMLCEAIVQHSYLKKN